MKVESKISYLGERNRILPEVEIFRFYYVSECNQQTDKTSFEMVRMTTSGFSVIFSLKFYRHLMASCEIRQSIHQDGGRRPVM